MQINGPFKQYLTQEVAKFTRDGTKLTKLNIVRVMTRALLRALTRSNILSAFKASGTYPTDARIVLDSLPKVVGVPIGKLNVAHAEEAKALMVELPPDLHEILYIPSPGAMIAKPSTKKKRPEKARLLVYQPMQALRKVPTVAALDIVAIPALEAPAQADSESKQADIQLAAHALVDTDLPAIDSKESKDGKDAKESIASGSAFLLNPGFGNESRSKRAKSSRGRGRGSRARARARGRGQGRGRQRGGRAEKKVDSDGDTAMSESDESASDSPPLSSTEEDEDSADESKDAVERAASDIEELATIREVNRVRRLTQVRRAGRAESNPSTLQESSASSSSSSSSSTSSAKASAGARVSGRKRVARD